MQKPKIQLKPKWNEENCSARFKSNKKQLSNKIIDDRFLVHKENKENDYRTKICA